MHAASLVRWAAAVVAISVSAASTAQAPVMVEVQAHSLSPAADGKGSRVGQGVARVAPVVMETRGHLHADGTVSTTCAAIASSVPHSVEATRPITKQQER